MSNLFRAVTIDVEGNAEAVRWDTTTGTLTSGQLLFGAGSKAVVVGNLSGDVTTSGSGATSIASGVVTLAKMSAGVLSGTAQSLPRARGR